MTFRKPAERDLKEIELLDYLRENFAYCAHGRLLHRFGKACGHAAGSKGENGYFLIRVYGVRMGLHRAIWAFHNGRLPEKGQVIDHINGDPGDNRIENLREATHSQNHANKLSPPRGKVGFHGVYFCKQARKFRAAIKVAGKKIYIGHFSSAKEAAEAYDKKGRDIYGEFWNAR